MVLRARIRRTSSTAPITDHTLPSVFLWLTEGFLEGGMLMRKLAAMILLLMLLLAGLLVAYIPALSLALPNLFFGA